MPTTLTLSTATKSAISYALAHGAGVNNENYILAYNSIYKDISGTAVNAGTKY